MTACGVDFGTSNSAVGVVCRDEVCLVPLEGDATLIPTAVFFDFDAGDRPSFGRAAMDAYVDGPEGRLMRSLKSVLGSALLNETTALSRSRIAFTSVIAGFLKHLKGKAEEFLGTELDQVIVGRPVHFVDNDAAGDRRAEASLAATARRAGFRDVGFALEPIAAAYHYETTVTREELVLVADIGGGTSDFSLLRLGPERRRCRDRRRDIWPTPECGSAAPISTEP